MRTFVFLAGALLAPASASAGTVLYCTDYNLTTDQMGVALAASGHTVTTMTDITTCDANIASGSWDVVVMAIQNNTFATPNFNAWVTAGKRAILQDWTRDATRGAAAGVTYTSSMNLSPVTVTDATLALGVSPNPFTLTNPGWGIYSMSMTPSGSGATSAGTFPSGSAIVIAHGGNVIINGWLTDTGGTASVRLYANELGYLATTCGDSDGDGYDSSSGTCGGTDCDDTNPSVHPGATEVCNSIDDDCDGAIDDGAGLPYYADADGDAYGNPAVSKFSCTVPSGYVSNDRDCDDTDKSDYPGAPEVVANGDDEDCDGVDSCYQDADKDKYGSTAVISSGDLDCIDSGESGVKTDCDDGTATVNPGATEVCNGIDDDCDTLIDEALGTTSYRDSDGDGYGDPSITTTDCGVSTGYVSNDDDCDDGRASVNPAASERCNGRDDDCDGTIDEADAIDAKTWYADMDGDGFGDPASSKKACTSPLDHSSNDDDCDDGNSTIYPGATEIPYDAIDQDCDGFDENDLDGDGYAADVTTGGTDCDDSDADTHPGAAESADGVDQDCDDVVDETTDWYDDDDDGFTESGGDCDDAVDSTSPADVEECNGVDDDCDGVIDEDTECSDDDGDSYTEEDGDCNDADGDASPGTAEVDANGVDDDCDGVTDSGGEDADRDGYTAEAGDCLVDDDTVYPGAAELEDGLDNDCDGLIDEGTATYDDDGDGYSEADGDCWDGEDDVNPGASESDNGVDDDCDGILDEGTDAYDDDGDGWSEAQGDCDDADDTVSPSTEETDDDRDEDCDGQVDEGAEDVDADGMSVADGDCNDADGWVRPGAAEMCDNVDNDCDGEIDEGCGEEEVTYDEKKCGCATPGSPVGATGLLAIVGLVVRRRRLHGDFAR